MLKLVEEDEALRIISNIMLVLIDEDRSHLYLILMIMRIHRQIKMTMTISIILIRDRWLERVSKCRDNRYRSWLT